MVKPSKDVSKKRRDVELRVKLSNEELQSFKTAAAKLGTTISTWARMTLRRDTGLSS